MMRICCPFCGPRDHDEFTYEGNASQVFPALDAPAEAWCEAVFFHDNLRGPVEELWRHSGGCGAFLVITRDTGTHEIAEVRMADPRDAAALAAPAREPAE
ncbi:MAG: sarcosine oxidase subunit delta [Pseudomonadota bacterium]